MDAEEYVKKLDELNRLKNDGFIDENEYNNQINKLEKAYSSKHDYKRNYSNDKNTNTNNGSPILSLVILVFTIIAGVNFFSSDTFKDLSATGKKIFSSLDNDDTYSKSNYDYSDYNYETETSSSSSYDYSIPETTIPNSNYDYSTSTTENNSNVQTQTETEVRETFDINITKTAKIVVDKDHIDYALTILNYQTESSNPEVGRVKEGEQWVIVNMKFENMTNSTVIIDKSDFSLVDGAKRYVYRPWYEQVGTEIDTVEIKGNSSATFGIRFVYYKEREMSLRYYNIDFDYTSPGYIDIKLR